jgi:tetratricopeptide (TPR) repeat protein
MRLILVAVLLGLPLLPQDSIDPAPPTSPFLIRGRVLLENGTKPPHPPFIATSCSMSFTTTWNTFALAFPVGGYGLAMPQCLVSASLPGYRTAAASPRPGMVLVLKKLGDTEGSLVSIASLSAPPAARKLFEKAESAAYRKQWANAKNLYRQATAAHPGYAAAWFALGEILESENDTPAAIHSYHDAIRTDPRFIKPFVALADLALRASDWPRALQYAERALALNPVEFPRAFLQHALAASHLGLLDIAEASAAKCIDLDYTHSAPGAIFLLATLLERRGDRPGARALYRRYLDISPDGANAPSTRARLAVLGPS